MTGSDENDLTARQGKALSALLGSRSIAEAAKHCGIGERTLFRFLKNPLFVSVYREARRDQVRRAIMQVQRISEKAVATLEAIMEDPTSKSTAKVIATKVVLDVAFRAIELDDLEARLHTLEQHVAGEHR